MKDAQVAARIAAMVDEARTRFLRTPNPLNLKTVADLEHEAERIRAAEQHEAKHWANERWCMVEGIGRRIVGLVRRLGDELEIIVPAHEMAGQTFGPRSLRMNMRYVLTVIELTEDEARRMVPGSLHHDFAMMPPPEPAEVSA